MAQQIASLYAEITADTKGLERGLAKTEQGLTQAAGSARQTGTRFTEMASKLNVAQQAFGMTAAAAGQVWGVLEEGSALNLASERFDNLTASIGTTSDALLNDLGKATGGMMSNADMIASASQIISLGLADNQKDVVDLAGLVSNLGWDMQQVIMTFANNSALRLDSLGLSLADVKERAAALEAQGYSTDKAFDLAVIQAGQAKLELLGGAADTGAGAMQRLTVEFENAKTGLAGFIALRSEGALIGVANTFDAVGEASDAGHSSLRNFLVIANEIGKTLPFTGDGLDDLIGLLEESEMATVEAIQSDENMIRIQQELQDARVAQAEAIDFSADKLNNYMSLEQMYGRAAADSAAASNTAGAAIRDAAAAHGELNARLGASFEGFVENADAMKPYTTMLEGVRTISYEVAGRTEEQNAALEDLQGAYERAQATITDYQIGVQGVGLSDEERNEKIQEQVEYMAQLDAAMQPLLGIQSEYATTTDGGRAATEALNKTLFDQIQASTDDANAIALAGVALGQLTEDQANAMLKAALLEEAIREQAEAWDGTAAGLVVMQGNLQMTIDTLNNMPSLVETEVRTNYTQTGSPVSIPDEHTGGVPGGSGRAVGGPVNAGTAYMVGERGPEMFVPSTNGAIVPNEKMGGVNIEHLTVNAQPGQDGYMLAQQMMQELGRLTRQQMRGR